MKINNIKSELIREYLDSIHSTYDKICIEFDKISNSCKNPTEILHELKPTIIQEWQKMYKSFVLKPIEDDVMSLFNKIQTDKFEKSKSIIKKVQIFEVYYYTAQYFYIFVLPVGVDQEFDDFPRFEIKMNENNLTLKSLFDIPFTIISTNFGITGTGVQSKFRYDKSPSIANSFLYLATDCSPLA
jgi:hypothetical protein